MHLRLNMQTTPHLSARLHSSMRTDRGEVEGVELVAPTLAQHSAKTLCMHGRSSNRSGKRGRKLARRAGLTRHCAMDLTPSQCGIRARRQRRQVRKHKAKL